MVVENEYDGGGRLISTTLDPTGVNAETTFSNFTTRGDPQTTLDPRGNATSTTYDALRRPTIVRRHDGNASADLLLATETSYDEMGRVTQTRGGTAFSGTSVSAWLTQETRSYTPTGQVSTITNGEGDVSRTCYDAMDRAYRTVDGVGRARVTLFDAAGQAIEQQGWWSANIEDDECELTSTLPGGQSTRHLAQRAYTLNGQVAWVDDANDNRSTYVYDGFDRLCRLFFPNPALGAEASNAPSVTPPDVLACDTTTSSGHDYEEYQYDANSNRTHLRLRSGDADTIVFNYDNLNRQTVKDIPGGSGADVYYAYDLAGRRLSARFVSISGNGIIYDYDSAGRLESETSYGRMLSFQYDDASNRTRITHDWGDGDEEFDYVFDATNRLDEIRENGSTVIANYGYDTLGRRNALSRPGGVNTTYGYDDASRLTDLAHDLASTANDQTYTFAYTDASQLSQRTASNDNYTWEAPEAETEYEANGLNQYTEVGVEAFEHDRRGNLIDDGVRQFCYDIENRLLAVAASGDDDCETPTMTLVYDPLGRLLQTVAGGTTTQFLYDGDALVAEFDGSEELQHRYVHGASVDEPVVWYEGANLTTRRSFVVDRQGSVIAVADSSGALIGNRYRYGPYGEPVSWSGSRFLYTGQIALPEVELYYYKARIYDPARGRFLQTDPIGYADDMVLYVYVRNDPMNASDPSGMCTGSRFENDDGTCLFGGMFTAGVGGVTDIAPLIAAESRERQPTSFRSENASERYDTAHDAARAAYKEIRDLNEEGGVCAGVECGAIIRETILGGKYYYQRIYRGDANGIPAMDEALFIFGRGARVIHNHPDSNWLLSGSDADNMRYLTQRHQYLITPDWGLRLFTRDPTPGLIPVTISGIQLYYGNIRTQ